MLYILYNVMCDIEQYSSWSIIYDFTSGPYIIICMMLTVLHLNETQNTPNYTAVRSKYNRYIVYVPI